MSNGICQYKETLEGPGEEAVAGKAGEWQNGFLLISWSCISFPILFCLIHFAFYNNAIKTPKQEADNH